MESFDQQPPAARTSSQLLAGRDGPSAWKFRAVRVFVSVLGGLLTLGALGTVGVMTHVESTYGAHFTALRERPARVGLLELRLNQGLRGADFPGLERWQDAAEKLGMELEHRVVESFAELDPDRFAAFVVPAQERISDAEWQQLLTLLRDGPGVVFTGHPGLQREDGRRRQELLLETLLPGERFERRRAAGTLLRVDERGPLVAGFAAGEELQLVRAGEALMRVRSSGLLWSEPDAFGAALHTTVDDTPLVWLATPAAELVRADQAGRLLENALRFAAREPIVELRPWPQAADAAAWVGAEREVVDRLEAAGLATPAPPSGSVAYEADADLFLGRLLADYARVERAAGLYLALREDLEGSDAGRISSSLIHELGARRVFLTDEASLSHWVRRRAEVSVALERVVPGRASLRVANRGGEAIEGSTVRVHLPAGARPPARLSVKGAEVPILRVATGRRWIDLVLPSLQAGEATSIDFVY